MTVVERHAEEHPVLAFRRWVKDIPDELYPAELVPVGQRYIPGVVAFPGSFGLYIEPGEDGATPPPFPHGGVMFVGNTLDGEANYLERYSLGQPHGDPAPDAQRMSFWKVLYAQQLLDPAGVPLDQIFVTNVHPALVRGESAQGSVSRKPANRSWWEHCQELLVAQLQEMRPAVLVTLGRSARTALNRLLETKLPAGGPQIISTELAGVPLQAVALAHPSAWTDRAEDTPVRRCNRTCCRRRRTGGSMASFWSPPAARLELPRAPVRRSSDPGGGREAAWGGPLDARRYRPTRADFATRRDGERPPRPPCRLREPGSHLGALTCAGSCPERSA